MKLDTRDFGQVEIDEKEILTFVSPIFGFEEYKKFALLYQESVSEHFVWLQSVEEPELCFILLSPDTVVDSYEPDIPQSISELLGDGAYMCWLIATIRDPFSDSTANLKSPIVVNPSLHKAAQVVLEEKLPIRYSLFREEDKKC